MHPTLKKAAAVLPVVLVSLFSGPRADAASIQLASVSSGLDAFGLNIDGSIFYDLSGPTFPGEADLLSFDTTTGLGAVNVTIGTPGAHYVGFWIDHEIDEATNTFFNEEGTAHNLGDLESGQSWEIDEPGFISGDIFPFSFEDGALDNSVGVGFGTTVFPDDVSAALAWDFSLAAGETGVVSFLASTTEPTSGFYLSHSDPDSFFDGDLDSTIYLSSSLGLLQNLNPPPGPGAPVPEPATVGLLGIGALVAAGARRRRRRPTSKS